MTIFLFVLILSVVAGLVAAGGDRMGHRAARRKLRIGKLRPRTVSTIIAVVTGVIISLATFGVVFLLWSDFREALTRYSTVKSDLASVQSELDGMQGDVDAARHEMEQAQVDRDAALAEAEDLNGQLSDMRGQTFELAKAIDLQQQELDEKLKEISGLQGQISGLEKKKIDLEEDIDSYADRMDELRDLIAQARRDLESYLEGDVIIPSGAYLAYQVVAAGDDGNIQSILQRALNRVNVNLSRDGLAIDSESEQLAMEFIGGYDIAGDGVIVISAARNVFDGTDVLLDFEAMPLTPLVNDGDVLMHVNVGTTTASVRTAAGTREISVPRQFDIGSLTDFTVILQTEMVEAALELGFLPNLQDGQYSTAVASLAEVADQIMTRERPLVIQFVARRDLNALDGMSDADIYISNPRQSTDGEDGDAAESGDDAAVPDTGGQS